MSRKNRFGAGLKNIMFDIEIFFSEIKKKTQLTLTSKTRKVFLVAVTVCIVILTVLGLWTCLSAGTEENKLVKYQYAHRANLDYEVFLKPNMLYEQQVLGMEKIYPSIFVEQVKTQLTYEFSGDQPADVKGNYTVIATVQGVQKEETKEVILWGKDFLLVPETPFSNAEGKVKLEKELWLSYESFNQFAQEVQKATEIASSVNLSIKWLIQVEAENKEGLIKEELAPQLVLPLCKKYFAISGELKPEKEGALEELVETNTPINKKRLALLSIGLVLFLLAFLYLWRFVKVATPSLWEKQLKGIFNKHGERLVALEKEIFLPREKIIRIKSIDDMVLLADEISRPIYYYHKTGIGNEGLSFYVLSENKVYLYELTAEDTNILFPQSDGLPFL